jgi:hypothetical protein
MSTRLGKSGDNRVTEGVEIGAPAPGNTGRQDAPCSGVIALHNTWASQTEGNGANRAGRHRITVPKHTALPNLVFIGELSSNLSFPIWILLQANHPVSYKIQQVPVFKILIVPFIVPLY